MPDRTRTDPSLWCPPCAAGNCPQRCEEGCHHVCDIEALWRLAAAALHDRLYGYPVGDHREGPQWDEAQALAGLVLHAIPEGWAKTDGEWRPQRNLGSRLRFVLHARRCADLLSTWARAMHGGVGSDCTCCRNCGAPYVRGRFGFCNGCAPFFDPHPAGCTCGDCPQNWGANG